MFKSKKLVALGLAAVALFSTVGVSLAYWASSVTGNTNNATGTVVVGSGNTVTTSVTVGNQTGGVQRLVPAGQAVDLNEVEQIDLVFSVSWDSAGLNGEGASSTLTVAEVSRVVTDSSAAVVTDNAIRALYVVTPPAGEAIIADGSDVNVTVTVTLTEPTLAQYASIQGGTCVVTLSFTVA